MVSSEDWAAALSSEIFRTYLKGEIQKEAEKTKTAEDELQVMEEFEEFQKRVNASPKLRNVFKKLQQSFINDPESTNKVDPKFVEGVLLLNIEDE